MGQEGTVAVGVREQEGEEEVQTWNQRKQAQILQLSEKLNHGDLESQIEAARDIRKLVRKSSSSSSSLSSSSSSMKTRSRLAAAGVIQPLVFMLVSPSLDAREASLLALLNIAVRNER
jgi:vacuolar protein 8